MKRMSWLVFLFSSAALPVGAQQAAPAAAFEAQLAAIQRSALPDVDELIAALSRTSDAQAQLDAIKALSSQMGGRDSSQQKKIVLALSEAARADGNGVEVHEQALEALGRCVSWFTNPTAAADAVETLCAATRADDPAVRVYALRGLVTASRKLPTCSQDLEARLTGTALDLSGRDQPPQERFLAFMALGNYFNDRGPGILYYRNDLLLRFQSVVLAPLEINLRDFYANDRDMRLAAMRVLRVAAGLYQPDGQLRLRIRQVFQGMANSELENDAILRQFARSCADTIRI